MFNSIQELAPNLLFYKTKYFLINLTMWVVNSYYYIVFEGGIGEKDN